MHQGGVEAPGEALGEGGGGHLGRPVVVARVAVASKTLLREGLHQAAVKLRPKAFPEVRIGQQMPLPLPPFRPTILEPHLEKMEKSDKCTQ